MIRIVHLYPDLLNLYGGRADINVLRRYLSECGEDVTVDEYERGQKPDFTDADLVYLGAGTELRMLAAAEELSGCEAELMEYIENDGYVLMTGSSVALALKEIVALDGEVHRGLGFAGDRAEIRDYRHYADVKGRTEISEKQIIGAVNTSLEVGFTAAPFMTVDFDSNRYVGDKEGFVYRNVAGTQLAAPLLARNPFFLRDFAEIVAGKRLEHPDAMWFNEAVDGYYYAAAAMEG